MDINSDTALLQLIWTKWLIEGTLLVSNTVPKYNYIMRNQPFEDWLFKEYDAIVHQYHGKRYINFFDNRKKTMLLLKYG